MAQLNLFGESMKVNTKHEEITHKAKSYTGIYALHKYWGKKPYNIISDFIQKYTEEDDIVLDPFLGSGVSLLEAVFNKRKGIGIDINPSATFITEQLFSSVGPKELAEEFRAIETELKTRINELYLVERHNTAYTGQNFLWENNILTEIRYSNGSRKRFVIRPEERDTQLAHSISVHDIPYFFPKNKFFHNSRINTNNKENLSELFTPRNLLALSLLYNRIEAIKSPDVKNMLLFCFTSAIGQASKMVFVIKLRNKTKGIAEVTHKKEIGSWVIGYWTPNEFFENNVWTCFETRFKKILKAQKEHYTMLRKYRSAYVYADLQHGADFLIINEPSQIYLKTLSENSVDYIITDPPHSNRIPYLELSMLWNGWLKKEVDYENEIIISEAKDRNKNIDNYNELLNDVIVECFRVLKPNKYFSFMFNSLDDESWLNVVRTFHQIGFSLQTIETLGYSAHSVVQDNRKNGLQTDFVITYMKPVSMTQDRDLKIIALTSNQKYRDDIKSMKSDGFKPFQIMNNILCRLLHHNQFTKISELIEVIEHA